jgi:pyruvate/2-oxoglutarate dehydrogenase complex dihydrolipoamide acyltransferase (E2) component
MKKDDFTVITFPASRLSTIDVGRIGAGRHHVAALLEVDVTDAKNRIRLLKQNGASISFTSWFVKCAACSAAAHPRAHGMLYRKRKVVEFHEVDVSMAVEKEVEGIMVPLPVVIRKADTKSVADIYAEIRNARAASVDHEGDLVIGQQRSGFAMKAYFALPRFMRLVVMKILTQSPFRGKKNMGTVMITTIGTAARVPGWILPRSMHTLCMGLGSIIRKPWVVNDAVVARDILHMTAMVDHDVIDGVPAARFISSLVDALESGAHL